MKTRLLKKVRKRYVIKHYSKQVMLYNRTYNTECMLLVDRNEEYTICGCEIGMHKKNIFENYSINREGARRILMAKLVEWIRKDYEHTKRTRNNQTIEKVWYNK